MVMKNLTYRRFLLNASPRTLQENTGKGLCPFGIRLDKNTCKETNILDCISPPELDEMKLWAYLDGEADQETVNHLESCEYCRGKVKDLIQVRNRVGSRLYRINCPSTLELGEYHLGLLDASKKLIVAQHLRECRHCQDEIAQLEKYLDEPTLRLDVLEPVRVLIAQLISGVGVNRDQADPSISATFAGLRGGEEEPYIYQADNFRIVIDIQDDVEQVGLKTLLGLVTGSKSNELTIQASQEGKTIATSSVDETGNFVISQLMPGRYELILASPNDEVHIESLSVK